MPSRSEHRPRHPATNEHSSSRASLAARMRRGNVAPYNDGRSDRHAATTTPPNSRAGLRRRGSDRCSGLALARTCCRRSPTGHVVCAVRAAPSRRVRRRRPPRAGRDVGLRPARDRVAHRRTASRRQQSRGCFGIEAADEFDRRDSDRRHEPEHRTLLRCIELRPQTYGTAGRSPLARARRSSRVVVRARVSGA